MFARSRVSSVCRDFFINRLVSSSLFPETVRFSQKFSSNYTLSPKHSMSFLAFSFAPPFLTLSLFGVQPSPSFCTILIPEFYAALLGFSQKAPETGRFRCFSAYSFSVSAQLKTFSSSSPDIVSCSNRYSAVAISAARCRVRISSQRLYASSMMRRISSSISAAVFSE